MSKEVMDKLASVAARAKAERDRVFSTLATEQNEATETKAEAEESMSQSQPSNHGTYVPNPENLDGITLPEEILKLGEKIAENVHEVWAQGRMKEGWRYGNEKDVDNKTTPCLVPYSSLPESEKAYDRNTAMETLKLIIKLGYKIEPADK